MDWKSTWKNTIREIEFSTPIDNIDVIDKTPVRESATQNSVNIVNIVNAPSGHALSDELTEEADLFFYLHDSISTGGPYRKLWPKVRRYIQGQIPVEMLQGLEEAFITQRRTT